MPAIDLIRETETSEPGDSGHGVAEKHVYKVRRLLSSPTRSCSDLNPISTLQLPPEAVNMVRFTLPLVALAMAASVAAAPAPGTSGTTFSFSQWVEDIIANPDTALSPDEAIEAAKAAIVTRSAGGLQKRVWCDNTPVRANVRHPSC